MSCSSSKFSVFIYKTAGFSVKVKISVKKKNYGVMLILVWSMKLDVNRSEIKPLPELLLELYMIPQIAPDYFKVTPMQI